jgi:Phospholipase B
MRAALVLAAFAAVGHGFVVAKQMPVKHVGVSPGVQYGEAILDMTSPAGITVQLSSTLPTPSSQTIAWGLFADNMNTTGAFLFRAKSDECRAISAKLCHPLLPLRFLVVAGWANMEIHGLRNANDSMMSYAAGALEGVMTWSRTYDFLLNAVVDAGQTFPKDLTNWLNENTAYAQKQAALNGDTDPFWYQTGLFFTQLQGLYDGYSSAAPKNKQVPWLVFYAATLVGDLFDLDVLFPDAIAEHSPLAGRLTRPGGEKSKGKITPRGMTHCSSMVGVAVPTTFDSSYASPCAAANANPTDIFMSHSTWAGYESMSRIFKMIDMPVATTGAPNAPIVPGTRVSFSSYPATLYSSDDVYATSAGLLIQETTINNYNESLYKEYTVPQTVLTWARVMVASRLATDGQSFSDVFLTQNSGTYNNAWQILTKSKFTPGQPLQDGLLMVVEQLPGE